MLSKSFTATRKYARCSNSAATTGVLLAIVLTLLCSHCFSSVAAGSTRRATEEERVADWYNSGNTWPPKWQHESPQMKEVLAHREKQIMSMKGSDERWENWLQFTQNRLVPRFTEVGFQIAPVPENVFKPLSEKITAAVANLDGLRSEGKVDVIYNISPYKTPKFADIGSLAKQTIDALKPLHEAWAGGIELMPTSAYGVRLYQNESTLVMHYDRVQTHVISSIVHIAHEYDNDDEPWPIQIEDHNGRLHSVSLEPGQMLFYESAKCLHGRMTKFKGRYYGSIFLHYQPVDKNIWSFTHNDIIAAVPPHWSQGVTREKGERWAGACITCDDRITELAQNRTEDGPAGGHITPFNTIFPADTVHIPPRKSSSSSSSSTSGGKTEL